LRIELAKENIFVTTVCPGIMRTGSHVHAEFKGNVDAEFQWFTSTAATPLTSMSAERAAQRIVLATARRSAEVIMPWQAKTLVLGQALAPGALEKIFRLMERLLPSQTSSQAASGAEIRKKAKPATMATALPESAADRLNERKSY
jgi:short-subunit dehydrogenase